MGSVLEATAATVRNDKYCQDQSLYSNHEHMITSTRLELGGITNESPCHFSENARNRDTKGETLVLAAKSLELMAQRWRYFVDAKR